MTELQELPTRNVLVPLFNARLSPFLAGFAQTFLNFSYHFTGKRN